MAGDPSLDVRSRRMCSTGDRDAGFGHAVNVTLGLPIVRTSVDHGTALDLAGTGRADAGSLVAALELALACVRA